MRAIRKKLPKSPPEIQRRAIELRSKSTDAERLIWSRLRTNRMNIKFRRQEPIGSYIVDFVSIDKGIIVELDGSQHYQVENRDYDAKRDKYLSSLGFEVLRFSDRDVLKDIEVVLSVIWEKIAPPLVPPRKLGGRVRHSPLRSRGEKKGG